MTDRPIAGLLGSRAADPGCEATFHVLDEYVDAVLRGDVIATYGEVLAHLENCPACHEDTDGLLAAMRWIGRRSGGR